MRPSQRSTGLRSGLVSRVGIRRANSTSVRNAGGSAARRRLSRAASAGGGASTGVARRRGMRDRDSDDGLGSAGGRMATSRLRGRGGRSEGEEGEDITEAKVRSRSLRRRLARTEDVLDMTVGPSYREDDVRANEEAIRELTVELHNERYIRADVEAQLRDTEQLVALKLNSLKVLEQRLKVCSLCFGA